MGKLLNTLKQRMAEQSGRAAHRTNGRAPADQGEKLVEDVLDMESTPISNGHGTHSALPSRQESRPLAQTKELLSAPSLALQASIVEPCAIVSEGGPLSEAGGPNIEVSAVLSVWPWAPEAIEIPFIEVPEPPGSAKASPAKDGVSEPAGKVETPAKVVFCTPKRLTPSRPDKVSPKLSIWRQPDGDSAGHYRKAKDPLLDAVRTASAKSVLLVPLDAHPDHSATVVNLALAIAEENQLRILLVDADKEDRPVSTLLGLASAPGWTEWLAGMPLPQIIQDSGWPGLHVVAAGNDLVGPDSTLADERARNFPALLQEKYDLLLVHSSPWSRSAAPLIRPTAETACVVLTPSQVGGLQADECLRGLQNHGCRVLGTLVVGPLS